ncbi:hypothetical protein BG005_000361, partial [Podila minutissima]
MASPQYRLPYVQETYQNTVQSMPVYPTLSSPSPTTSLAYPMPVSSPAQSYTTQQQTYPLLPMSSPTPSHSSQGYPVLPTNSGFPSPASTHSYLPSTQPYGPHYPPQPYQPYQDDAPPYSPREQHPYQLPGFSQAPPLSPRVQQNPFIPMAAPVQPPPPPPPARTTYVPPPSSSSRTSAIPTALTTPTPRLRRDSDPVQMILPTLPSLPARPAPTPSAKCCVLKPLPYGWSPTTPDGQVDPMDAALSAAPTNGYQNVHWNHAFRDLQCDGGCKNPFAFASRIRYTCVTCKNSSFDLCEACFGRFEGEEEEEGGGMGAIHNPNHELMKMDLAFPDWSHPAWNGGIEDLGKAVRQIGAKTLAWEKGDAKRGQECVLHMLLPEEVSRKPEVLEMDGMNLSAIGLIAILTRLEQNLTEITVRSGPELGGMELAKVFMVFLDE